MSVETTFGEVILDDRRRGVFPKARPRQRFTVSLTPEGQYIFTPSAPGRVHPAFLKIPRRPAGFFSAALGDSETRRIRAATAAAATERRARR